jgi:uncharacterized membrane protein
MWKHKFIEFLEEITVATKRNSKTSNINKSYFLSNLMQLLGISTKYLDTKGYLMS